ncbi:hypothetical protein BO94DRAFT_585895 [Aspergillus sclerotioniger CBS 115572]|uniref:Uncharacterized protein n=1 Tax=Aspergillus sclerotioniger CBS 115572 TaxID=1450535 RepID=A0A317WQE3_9EURO|nr:hypothetical protein BO94DRAFT_585895 [Aspergillus sclerotioniger CBS 115572]PWY87347.1 hypothetical protein BO94DRAFT_585895 [Aspergillus sclerotioniger CBS 115572]
MRVDVASPVLDTTNGLTPESSDSDETGASINGHGEQGIHDSVPGFIPIAICGMACRLPGGIRSPEQMWNFLLNKGDARSRVPESRYNIDAYYSPVDKPGSIKTQYGYFLDDDLSKADGSLFTMSPMELGRCDPQQRLMLEVARECIEDAGEVDWKGTRTGVYMGNFGEDWSEMSDKESQQYGVYRLAGLGDFALANRVSYEMDLQGPSMTIRTACSSSLVALNEACLAIARGDCKSAIVGGASLILTPTMSIKLTEQGVLSPDASCKTFSADANGYGRAEAINAVYVKPLTDAIRAGNPVRAVIRGTATNSDGKTPGMTYPSVEAQEALIRRAYTIAGIADYAATPFLELHGTGTVVGDRIETNAVAKVFGDSGTYIGSVKPNLGHSEGASGLTSVIQAVLALENRIIPPNIKFTLPNPSIPFQPAKLQVPVEATPWPESRMERISVNSFGIGGSNAHVILDSASAHNASPRREEASDHPQLLVLSASSPASLETMIEDYRAYLSNHAEAIEDLAFTLANRREHLPYRAFVVASREQPGSASAIAKPAPTPNVVMVFTGQGAQWPQMGRDLLRSNAVFRASIKGLDQHLKGLGAAGPTWTIEAELRKPAKTSKLGTAELSQPLCTAIQIALVDSLAAVGIVPDAVVGHSNGEIAGAYAAGALTAAEAITAAFHRRAIAQRQTRPGAMAAIGMSWEEVKEFLVPTVGVACENSPKSVTLSGDADKVEAVVSKIQKSRPDVLARLLKVDKAYHSYHMAEVGGDYYNLVGPNVLGQSPAKLFFSSVTGKLLSENEALGARICRHSIGKNAVFLEVGPHSALAGPVRQILSDNSSTAPYVAAMLRQQSCTDALLSAIGKLYTLHVSIDFAAMFPTGTCLPDLPRYAWNYEKSYWHETRVTREWRQRQHGYHDLLGVKATECTDFEPVWRNMFHVDNAPWVRDHKVNDDIVFPFAGYVAMAGEAVRQVTGVQDGFQVRNVLATTALVVNEGKPVEMVTTLRRHRLTHSDDSEWWEFTIGSHNGHVWTRHCTGQVRDQVGSLGPGEAIPQLPRKIGSRQWYDVLRRGGLEFGPRFQCMEDIRSSTNFPGRSTAHIQNHGQGDESMYHLHPVVIDASLQLLVCAAAYGLGLKHRNNVATGVGALSITRCSSNLVASASAAFTYNGSVSGEGQCIGDGQVVLRMSGVRHTVLEAPETGDTHAAAHQVWGPHIDLVNPGSLLKPSIDKAMYMPTLNELAQLCMLRSWKSIAGLQANLPHLQKYQAWLDTEIHSREPLSPAWKHLDEKGLLDRINTRVKHLSETPAAPAAAAISLVSSASKSLLSGEREVFDLLDEGDTGINLHSFIEDFDPSLLLHVLAHSRPNLRILELGAGSGARTSKILAHLESFYSKYTVSDPSSSLITTAKERLQGVQNLEFTTFDISKDLEEQDFGERQYDLIIATNALYKTESLGASLTNARKLLHPRRRLVLQELCPSSKWINYIFGLLRGWWLGAEDGRTSEPYVDMKRWERELEKAGFDGFDTVVPDSDEPFQLTAAVVAWPKPAVDVVKKVTLLAADNASDLGPMLEELQKQNYQISRCTIHGRPPAGQDVISLLDQNAPFFEELTAGTFDRLRAFLAGLGPRLPGRLGDLRWSRQPVKQLVGNQVEVEVFSAGLNYQDVLVATGALELPVPVFGLEASGVVHRTGPEVKHLQVGERVMGLVQGALSSVVQASEMLFAPIPDQLSFNEAATLPFSYATALYILTEIGHVEAGQSILIHQGCSGVGLAAIQLGQIIGAEIFATVGNDNQLSYLVETFGLPRDHLFLDANGLWVDGIKAQTQGRGVDVVLNSIAGESLHASWRCVAEFGRMIELGKKDILGAGKLDMDVFLLNRSYCYVDVDRIRAGKPSTIARLLRDTLDFYRKGLIQPIHPVQIFGASGILDAFSDVQRSEHTGKTVVELRQSGETNLLPLDVAKRRMTPQFNSSSSYLLVGGLGGLGRTVAIWMVEHGARHLIFLSRNAGSGPQDQSFVHELATMGCEAHLVKGSVSDMAAVTQAIQVSTAPLKGVLQMSTVLRDQAYPKMTWDDWSAATSPKIQGTWNLHNATVAAGIDLDFFVLFSSISGIIGQPGQANYASANTFLDAFHEYRSGLGLASSVLQLGPVDDVGVFYGNDDMLRQLKSAGFYCIRGKEVLDALVLATSHPTSFSVGLRSTTSLDSENNRLVWRKDPRMAVYRNNSGGGAAGGDGAAAAHNELKGLLATARADPSALEKPETIELLAREIGRKVLGLLLKPEEDLNTSLGLADLGMDSLVAIEMRTWWKQTFRFDISVLEMLGMGTLEVLGKHAAEGLRRPFEQ